MITSKNLRMIFMKSHILVFFVVTVFALLLLTGCNNASDSEDEIADNSMTTYETITATEAKTLMENEDNYIILDVRTQEEYDDGHIEGAILIPDYDIGEKAESILLDKEQLLLVYCRSGRRSKNAASELIDLGYSNVKEFGGIIDWAYGIVRD